MKRVIFASMVLLLCALFFTGGVLAAEKFAYADMIQLISEYGKAKDYEKVLIDKQNAYRAELDKKANEVKQFEDKMNLLSDKEKEAKKEEFETKVKALQDFGRQKSTDLRKEQDEKMQEVYKDVGEAIKQYAEKEGYALVFDNRLLVYQTKNMDITAKVVGILNKGYKK